MKQKKGWKALGIVTAIALVTAACGGKSEGESGSAEGYPKQTINIVVPFSAGDISDLATRAFAEYASSSLGQSVVVVNKEGGGGAVGHAEVAKAKGDGYTLLTGSTGAMEVRPAMADVGFTYKDFKPIGQLTELPFAVVVSKNSQFENLEQFVDYAKANPGKLKYATAGVGTTNHIAMETLSKKYEVQMTHVPYAGGNEALAAVLGGHVDAVNVTATQVLSQHAAGEVKVLGVTSAERLKDMADVPTFKEQGYDLTLSVWFGLFAPKSTPDAIVEKLTSVMEAAKSDAKLNEKWENLKIAPQFVIGKDFVSKIESEVKSYGETIEQIGLAKK